MILEFRYEDDDEDAIHSLLSALTFQEFESFLSSYNAVYEKHQSKEKYTLEFKDIYYDLYCIVYDEDTYKGISCPKRIKTYIVYGT